MNKYFFSSLTRISDLAEEGFSVAPIDQTEWEMGDYVVGEVVSRPGALSRVELRSGRMIELVPEDLVVGAFGIRGATLEAVGSWEDIGPEQRFHAMTSAGLFGRVTSLAPLIVPRATLKVSSVSTLVSPLTFTVIVCSSLAVPEKVSEPSLSL